MNSTGTVSVLWLAHSIASRSCSRSPVVVAAVEILAAPVGVWTHQASAVRKWTWSRVGYFHQAAEAGEGEFVVVAQGVEDRKCFVGKRFGVDAEEVLGDGGTPLRQA